jgi:hypothetical protein
MDTTMIEISQGSPFQDQQTFSEETPHPPFTNLLKQTMPAEETTQNNAIILLHFHLKQHSQARQ